MFILKFFIDPSGEVVNVVDTHIVTVITNPERFNVTKDWVNKVYEKYDERIGTENKAREEILVKLFKDGWIRVRYHRKYDYWMFQMHELTTEKKELLSAFTATAMSSGINGEQYYQNADVYALDYTGKMVLKSKFGDVGRGNL